MQIYVPGEDDSEETRVPLLPETVRQLSGLGCEISVEPGLGAALGVSDSAYMEAGAGATRPREEGLKSADLVLRLNKPSPGEVDILKPGCLHISFLDPFTDASVLRLLAEKSVDAIAMELMPRTTLAQKMDALSSQANLAGYVAVILAAERLPRLFPMMMTPAGTLQPARVLVVGAGVAGLQAIATARRLGARVQAYDTRPTAAEQVRSLGARFVEIKLGETGQTEQGYAKALTDQQIESQRQALQKHCADADVVITTAQVFGKKAPVIVTEEMVRGMKAGSVVVDAAADTGGNVACAAIGQETMVGSVRVLAFRNLSRRVPVHASQVYSNNLGNLVEHFWDKERKEFVLKREDEILRGALATQGGRIVNPLFV